MGKYYYFYNLKDCKKDRSKGIRRITKYGYDNKLPLKDRDTLIRANKIEIVYYILLSPFRSFSSWWSKLNTNQKISIVGIIVVAIINILGWFIL